MTERAAPLITGMALFAARVPCEPATDGFMAIAIAGLC